MKASVSFISDHKYSLNLICFNYSYSLGPPADPSYNFLADSERDGPKTSPNDSNKKDWRNNNNSTSSNNTTTSSSSSSSSGSNFNRRSNNNNSFNRGKNTSKGKASIAKGKSNDEIVQRKIERERNNDKVMHRQQSSEGSWRREAKEQKITANHRIDDRQSRKIGSNNNTISMTITRQQLNQSQTLKSEVNNLPEKLTDLAIEKRGNITVSVTKDGEVKSVKCNFYLTLLFCASDFFFF